MTSDRAGVQKFHELTDSSLSTSVRIISDEIAGTYIELFYDPEANEKPVPHDHLFSKLINAPLNCDCGHSTPCLDCGFCRRCASKTLFLGEGLCGTCIYQVAQWAIRKLRVHDLV